jgi:Ferredoxin thioredoxin reductase variable alpha chain
VLLAEKREQSMKIGDRVRIIESIVVYHHPEHKKEAFDLKGSEGEIVDIIIDWQGRPISPNLPIVVQLGKKFKAHFRDNELEVI